MMSSRYSAYALCALLLAGGINADASSRKLLQTDYQGSPATITVSAANPNVNAITITLAIPYPQNAYFCNVTGDPRIPQQGVFPLTVRVPVGTTSTVIFANISGPIPGLTCTGTPTAANCRPSSSPYVQGPPSVTNSPSIIQQPGTPGVTVVQQQGTPASVVQQQPSSVVQQQTPASVVQQQTPASVVQQQTPASVVQQQTPASVVQQQTPASVVQQQTPASVVQQTTPTSISSIVQQQTPSAVVQQGRHLLQAGTIEFISNNGTSGAINVLNTEEGVPNISFTAQYAGQQASFSGALQVAKTTTNNGFGTPYIPYQVDPALSPQCGVQVNFVGF